jgi:hypothetical protein
MDKVIKAMLDSSMGQFVSIDFIKKDGSPRTVTGKLAPVSPSMANHEQYLNIMLSAKDDSGKVQYRNVNTDTVTGVRMGGKVYVIREA